ncbi:MAG: SufD family Fe-S cluster assembly protein [Rectinemataceae bacterium]
MNILELKIVSHTVIESGASAQFMAHCTFPNAVKVVHLMDADLEIREGAKLSYLERHVHGPDGGVTIIPKTRVTLREGARFSTEFELIKGAAGAIELDYEAVCEKDAVVEMKTRIFGRGADTIHVREAAIGSVDSKQLETLLSRGLTEDAATDLIINGLLR